MEKGTSNNTNNKIKKIAILGPESTGKTSLAKNLAEHYKTFWIPEYARNYIENLGRKYLYNDVVHIANQQVILEEEFSKKATNYLFLDTELIITKIWFLEVFKDAPEWIDEAIKKSQIDLYLLCYPDLKWQFDEVRENPTKRFYLYDLYKSELERKNFNYSVIKGFGDARLDNAIKIIDNNDPHT